MICAIPLPAWQALSIAPTSETNRRDATLTGRTRLSFAKLPLEGPTVRGVVEGDAGVIGNIRRMLGPAMRRDVAGRRHREDARFNQLARDKRAGRRVANRPSRAFPVMFSYGDV
jgi:hypothetical protein